MSDESTAVQALVEDLAMSRILQTELLRLLQRPLARQQVNALPPRLVARLLHDAGVALQLVEGVRLELLQALGLSLAHDTDSPFAPAPESEEMSDS
jgi:hypothetical protein